jgi:uncharacterized membrane protein (DUF441 family)
LLKKWIEEHFKLFGVLLLILAVLNTWVASEIFLDYPIMALANGAMAIVIVVGVILSWGQAGPSGNGAHHSYLKATMGSTFVARWAGM